MTKQVNYLYPISLLIIVGFASLLYINYPLAYNQGLYHYQGLVLLKGGLPYADFVEKKGPMGLLFYGLAAILFGPSPIAYRFFDLLIQAISGVFLYMTLKKETPPWLKIIVPVIWFTHTLVEAPGNTADVTNAITLCLTITFYLLTSRKKNIEWVLGILMACACWIKPTAFVMFLPVWIIVYHNTKGEVTSLVFKAYFKIIGGVLAISIGFIAYLLISNTWLGFWEAVVLDPLLNYVDDRSRLGFRFVEKFGFSILSDPIFRLLGGIGLILFFKNRVVKISLLFILSILGSILIEGKYFPYHFSPLWPFISIGFFYMIKLLCEKIKGVILIKKSIFLLALTILIAPILVIGRTFANADFFSSKKFDQSRIFKIIAFRDLHLGREELIEYLKVRIKDEESIYTLAIDPNIYIDLERTSNCRFIRDASMLTKGLRNISTPTYLKRWEEEIMEYLHEIPDWLIIDNELPGGQFMPVYKSKIDLILQRNYNSGIILGRYTLYKKT